MIQTIYGVRLATQEKEQLRRMIRAGWSSAQAITRARILPKTDEGWTAPQVAAASDVSERTAFRTNRRYAEEGTGIGVEVPLPGKPVPEGGRRGGGRLIALAGVRLRGS